MNSIIILALALTGVVRAEVYHIDAHSSAKAVRPGDYIMGTPTNPDGVPLSANNYYLMKDKAPWLPVMGEIHYSRYPASLWEDAVKKMKAGGIDIVATYCFWIHHEEIEGEFDFTGRRDLRRFVERCQANNLSLWLRIGPWCHGEVRNGGFPDWLRETGIRTRRNDPEYLRRVRILYQQYFDQVKGLLYKDGGPIIGIQLENEYSGPEHLLALKRIAREVGFDVPFYTVTGWNNVRIPDREVIPVQAGYPDDFWTPGYDRTPLNEQYLFMAGIPINTGVGSDVLPVLEVYGGRTYDPSDYPWLTAELGLGIQWTHRRRPVIEARDAGALMLVKLAGGGNCVGYYMYHGGSNPQGKRTTLNETRPNLCPVISYDFQAAVGEFGEIVPKYHVLKLVHYWLQDFGTDLAPMIPAMPAKRPASVEDIDTFRCMVRADDDSGYLFFNNYQRYIENKDLNGLQVEVRLKRGSVTLPAEPITIPKDTYGIWPINLDMNGAVLEYATAQLFAKLSDNEADTYFFFAHEGIAPELVFKSDTISDLEAGDKNQVSANSQQTSISAKEISLANTIFVKSKTGKTVRICVMPREQALHATRLDLWGLPRLVVTDNANTIASHGDLDILSMGKANGSVWIYPSPDTVRMAGNTLQGKDEGIFRKFDWAIDRKDVSVELRQIAQGNNPKYEISIPSDALDGVYDLYLDIAHVCDYMTAKLDGRLLGDWYYIGKDYRPSLLHWGEQVLGKTITLELTPITAQTRCFIEDEFRPNFSVKQAYAEINSFSTVPLYRTTLSIVNNNVKQKNTINLSGNGAFQLDPDDKGMAEQWYSNQLQDEIKLRGSLQEQGYGEKPFVNTDWTARIGKRLLSDPGFAEWEKP